MIINVLRTYYKDFTEGSLYINGEFFCYVLEDIGRLTKIKKETCIPEGHYQVGISVSTRWNKPMMLLYNTSERTVSRWGLEFTGIRPHGGNSTDDTEGCPILGFNSNHKGRVWNRASDKLFLQVQDSMDSGEDINWIISEDCNGRKH